MALTKVSRGLLSTSIVDNGNATAITIDANENVGIGSSSPDAPLKIDGGSTANTVLHLTSGTANTFLKLSDSNTSNGGFIGYTTEDMTFFTNNTERLRINSGGWVNPKSNVALTNAPDTQGLHFGWNYSNGSGESLIVFNKGAGTTGGLTFVDNSTGGTHDEVMRLEGGNLLVGKTGTGDYVTGFEVQPAGAVLAYRTNGVASIFGRTNDGEITRFTTNSQIVGQIGSGSSGLFIGSSSQTSGISFFGTALYPNAGSSISATDGANDLGAPTARWKNLYLSGGAYLGGTGSANYLDDYEQGSWTSTTAGITGANVTAANYTKIGQLVSCDMRVAWTGSTQDNTALTFSLPFTANNPGAASRTGIVFYAGSSLLGGNAISAHVSVGGTVVSFYGTGGGTFRSIIASDINGSYDWLVSFSYFTDS